MLFFLACISVAGVSGDWLSHKASLGLSFGVREDGYRMKQYEATDIFISQHNEGFQRGEVLFAVGHNKFSHMSLDEFCASRANGLNHVLIDDILNGTEVDERSSSLPMSLPTELDWRSNGIETFVRDQGDCNACYAISAAQAIEGLHFLRHGKLLTLSEQQLLDCSLETGNTGCEGGRMSAAFQWVKKNKGIMDNDVYPYEGKAGSCRSDPSKSVAQIKGFMSMPKKSGEEGLMKAVTLNGPISVSIDAFYKSLAQYTHGIWSEAKCTENVTHAILLVGYGDEDGEPYWLLKNSWGTGWGNEGYFKMSRKTTCGIYTMVTYPYM